MACPAGYVPCGRGCGGCVPEGQDMHDNCGGGDRQKTIPADVETEPQDPENPE